MYACIEPLKPNLHGGGVSSAEVGPGSFLVPRHWQPLAFKMMTVKRKQEDSRKVYSVGNRQNLWYALQELSPVLKVVRLSVQSKMSIR
jgi:hypothetical protein